MESDHPPPGGWHGLGCPLHVLDCEPLNTGRASQPSMHIVCAHAHVHIYIHAYPHALTPTQITCARMHMPSGYAHRHACTQCLHIPAQGTRSHVCAHMSPKSVHAHRHTCTRAQACTHNKCMSSHTHMHTHPGLPEYLKGWGHRVNGDLCLFLLLPSQGVPQHTGSHSCGHPAHAPAAVPLATLSTGF